MNNVNPSNNETPSNSPNPSNNAENSANPSNSASPSNNATPADSASPSNNATPADSASPSNNATPADSASPSNNVENSATPSNRADNTPENTPENTHRRGTEELLARPAGLIGDLATVARRSLRSMIRDKEAVIPPLIIGAFFYVVNVGSLAKLTQGATSVSNYKAFQLPPAVIFGVTGLSRAAALVTDINNGYFDRLLATPVRRITLLLGLMMADFALAFALTLPIIGVAMAFGVRFATGVAGIFVFALLCGLWGLAFTGFSYAIALKTANPAAVNSAFLIFFPFAFLTTTAVPKSAMSSWLQNIVSLNPVTYLLEGLRSIITNGWTTTIFGTLGAIAGVFAIGFTLSFRALQGRVNKR